MEYLDKALEKVKSTAKKIDVEKLKEKTVKYVNKGMQVYRNWDTFGYVIKCNNAT